MDTFLFSASCFLLLIRLLPCPSSWAGHVASRPAMLAASAPYPLYSCLVARLGGQWWHQPGPGCALPWLTGCLWGLTGGFGGSVLLYNVLICVWVLREETLFSGTSAEEN